MYKNKRMDICHKNVYVTPYDGWGLSPHFHKLEGLPSPFVRKVWERTFVTDVKNCVLVFNFWLQNINHVNKRSRSRKF